MTISSIRLQNFILFFFWALIFWNGSWEYRPGMDAMTYGALAKHILSSGDWLRLHYADQAYANFYQHPPLVMWLTAIVFKFFGATDLTLKILPSLAGLGAIAGVVFWGTRWKDSWTGFWAGIILLSSIRFTKYSVTLMLDPFLAVFLIWGAILFLLSEEKLRYAVASGLCMGLAFMSKGVPSLVLPAALLLWAVFSQDRRSHWLKAYLLMLGAAVLILAAWFFAGDGWEYLRNYWLQSVRRRAGGGSLSGKFAPLQNLFKVYWPWLPIFLFGTWKILSGPWQTLRARLANPMGLALLLALMVLGGFVYSGHFLEHYLVPFYPFAALVVAGPMAQWTARFQPKVIAFFSGLVVVYALLAATLPLHLNGNEYENPIRIVLARAAQECDRTQVTRIMISKGVAEIWYALSMGLWQTPWDVISADARLFDGAADGTLLLVNAREQVSDKWARTRIFEKEYWIYQKVGGVACPL